MSHETIRIEIERRSDDRIHRSTRMLASTATTSLRIPESDHIQTVIADMRRDLDKLGNKGVDDERHLFCGNLDACLQEAKRIRIKRRPIHRITAVHHLQGIGSGTIHLCYGFEDYWTVEMEMIAKSRGINVVHEPSLN